MKKLMTILVVFALCGVAMARGGNNQNPPPPNGGNNNSGISGTDSAAVQIPLTDGTHEYINFTSETSQGNSGLDYTVSNSFHKSGYAENVRMGHTYFTTISQAELAAMNKNVDKVTVQFVGAQWDNSGTATKWTGEYGIYLYDPTNTSAERTYMSVQQYNNTFELNPGQSFGVYYAVDTTKTVYPNWDILGWFGEEVTVTNYYTSTEGYIGNFDTGIKSGEHQGQNVITVYSAENPEGAEDYTYKKFMCLMTDANGSSRHWEFMLQTTLDDNAVVVVPDSPSGQPLPGTLATLLIGSLCASALRKKNQK